MKKKSGRISGDNIIENVHKKIRVLSITEKDVKDVIVWARKK